MDKVWPWLASLLRGTRDDLLASSSPANRSFPLAASPDGTRIVLRADMTASAVDGDENDGKLVAFSLAIINCPPNGGARTLWTSEGFAASSPVASLRVRLLVQLLDEVIALSPSVPCLGADDATSEARLDAELVQAVVIGAAGGADGASAPAAAAFFSLALLLRLFWCCALDAPADSGYLFFRVLGSEIEHALGECRPALGAFLRAVGPDVEERLMRSLGYMLTKWCLLREIQAAAGSPPSSSETTPMSPPPRQRNTLPATAVCLSHAAEAHGLWVLRGYAPVLAMPRVMGASAEASSALAHEETALRYGLAHQQLEAVAQLEYVVRAARGGRFVTVAVRVDNVRIRVARLGFRRDDEDGDSAADDVMDVERHFPSRIRLWVGPQYGAAYATGPSLGRSTGNPERDIETARVVKGAFSGSAAATKLANGSSCSVGPPRMKVKMRSSVRTRSRCWRWEQEVEGSAGVFEGVLCDPVTGTEVSAWRPAAGFRTDPRNGMRHRYGGAGRAFSKMRGLVVAGDELPEEVTWRVGREVEGRTLRWRLGLKVWVSYLPNEVRSRHFETRCVEWAHEVDLPLVAVDGDQT